MKRAILSFDYELFFGDKSGTVQKTLIEPTNIMLNVLDEVEPLDDKMIPSDAFEREFIANSSLSY